MDLVKVVVPRKMSTNIIAICTTNADNLRIRSKANYEKVQTGCDLTYALNTCYFSLKMLLSCLTNVTLNFYKHYNLKQKMPFAIK